MAVVKHLQGFSALDPVPLPSEGMMQVLLCVMIWLIKSNGCSTPVDAGARRPDAFEYTNTTETDSPVSREQRHKHPSTIRQGSAAPPHSRFTASTEPSIANLELWLLAGLFSALSRSPLPLPSTQSYRWH